MPITTDELATLLSGLKHGTIEASIRDTGVRSVGGPNNIDLTQSIANTRIIDVYEPTRAAVDHRLDGAAKSGHVITLEQARELRDAGARLERSLD